MKFIVDRYIPFIEGRLEPFGEVAYLDPKAIDADAVADADALAIRTRTHCNASLLAESRVCAIATATIGTDHLDLEWCADNGIATFNAPGCNAPGVAQYVWSALLRLGLKPGDTVGVVGVGNVGSIVAAWGRMMGFRILLCDPPKQRLQGDDSDDIYHSLQEVMAQSDAVTLHTPLTRLGEDATYHMVGEAELAQMRRGAVLVNAARGGVVDEAALKQVMRRNGVRAVIDTWEREPQIDRELLAVAEYATCHIAGYSEEGKRRATRMTLENFERFYGIEIDKSGLTERYQMPESISPEAIVASYDPMTDTALLRANPEQFEQLRSSYNYRKEV